MEFVELERLEDWQFDMLTPVGKERHHHETQMLYEISGSVPFGFMGINTASYFAKHAFLWFVLYPGVTPTRADIREAKKVNLLELFPYELVASVDKGDKMKNHFARFFGMEYVTTDAQWDYYRKVM